MAQFIKTIQNFAFSNQLWEKNSKIIIGVSGGSDSSCLLDIFSRLAPKYNLDLHIAHVNYGLRGEDSKMDEIFVRKLSKKYNIEVSIFKPKKSQYKGNLESSLREIRYDFFEKLRQEIGFDLIAIAHNQDDQAETVLMRIMRGSGLHGLRGMKAKTKNIIRPLLQTNKVDILAHMKQNKLSYRTDESNFDEKFTRNNIRGSLLPYLEKNFNPTIKKTLSDWAVSVADDYDFIAQSGKDFAQDACKNKIADFSAQKFLLLHPAIERQVLRIVLGEIKNGLADLENGQIEEVIKLIKSTKSKSQKASIFGLNISKKGDKVEIRC